MEQLDQWIDQHQWLARDRYPFSSNGCRQGENIFDLHQFQIHKFNPFESMLWKLDNEQLSEAFDWFERERLEGVYRWQVLGEEKATVYVAGKLMMEYLKCLISHRSQSEPTQDIPAIRYEIARISRSFPEVGSHHLITEFERCGICLKR